MRSNEMRSNIILYEFRFDSEVGKRIPLSPTLQVLFVLLERQTERRQKFLEGLMI